MKVRKAKFASSTSNHLDFIRASQSKAKFSLITCTKVIIDLP